MSKRDLQKAREVKGVSYVDYEAWWSTPGEGSRGEEERGRAVVESSKDRRWRIRGPGRAREGGAPPGGGGGLEDVVCSSRVALLHCCMVAPSAAQMGCSTKEAEGDLLGRPGRVGPAQGEVVAQLQD